MRENASVGAIAVEPSPPLDVACVDREDQKRRHMPPSSHSPKTPSPTLSDPKTIRRHVRTLMGGPNHLRGPQETHTAINAIWQVVATASTFLELGTPSQGLLMLQAVTDVFTTRWMFVNDIHDEVSNFFEALAIVWTEALLSCDLTSKERTQWTKQFTTWQTRLGDWSIRAVFDAPLAAIREGWEQPELQRILQGTSLHPKVWDGETPAYATVLTHARLTVLERRKQIQEYLRLAQAEGCTVEYTTMLVRQGQVPEALSYGLHHLTTAEDAFVLAQAMSAHHEHPSSLHIAAHGLTLEGNRVPLAIWLREQAGSIGENLLALEAGEVVFRGEPTLEHYLKVAQIAGPTWPQYRERLLDSARHAPFTADPQGLIRVFLAEHLFDDAIAVLKTTRRYALVIQVADAALEEQTSLEWVIQACRWQAEHIMNGAKAQFYYAVPSWLTKVRTAYHLLGRDEEWHAYLAELVERHKLKSKLLPLLMALRES